MKINFNNKVYRNCTKNNSQIFSFKNFNNQSLIKNKISKDTFEKSQITFGSNGYEGNKTTQDCEKKAEEFCEKYHAYKEIEICTGTTQLFDTKDRLLYDHILRLVNYEHDEELARTILSKLHVFGPIGFESNTYCNREIPIFVDGEPSLEHLLDFAETNKSWY